MTGGRGSVSVRRVLIVGATSAIAVACARRWADAGAEMVLVARNPERLAATAGDLKARGAGRTATCLLDIDRLDAHGAMLDQAFESLGSVDIVLVAPGTLPDQQACEKDAALAAREFSTNALALIALLTGLALKLEAQKHGTIAVISSVAGDRGRASNYLYGAAKAALSTFCEGLRARLFRSGVHVLTVKPGFVATPMTAALDLPAALTASPDRVARDILAAIERRRDVLYTPRFWALVMLVIRTIPSFVFKRIRL
jgi:short-subunit dehydrogenase